MEAKVGHQDRMGDLGVSALQVIKVLDPDKIQVVVLGTLGVMEEEVEETHRGSQVKEHNHLLDLQEVPVKKLAVLKVTVAEEADVEGAVTPMMMTTMAMIGVNVVLDMTKTITRH
jgi:hypothetical protein